MKDPKYTLFAFQRILKKPKHNNKKTPNQNNNKKLKRKTQTNHQGSIFKLIKIFDMLKKAPSNYHIAISKKYSGVEICLN